MSFGGEISYVSCLGIAMMYYWEKQDSEKFQLHNPLFVEVKKEKFIWAYFSVYMWKFMSVYKYRDAQP